MISRSLQYERPSLYIFHASGVEILRGSFIDELSDQTLHALNTIYSAESMARLRNNDLEAAR